MTSPLAFQRDTERLSRALARIAIQLRIGSVHNGAMLRERLIEIARELAEHERAEAELLSHVHLKNPLENHVARASLRQLTQAEERLEKFLQCWPTASSIDALHEEFAADAGRLIDALRVLLRREQRDLNRIVARAG